jgi:hypothetical protein
LVQRFREQIAGASHTWVEAAAALFFQNTPFYPTSEPLHQLSALRRDESVRQSTHSDVLTVVAIRNKSVNGT